VGYRVGGALEPPLIARRKLASGFRGSVRRLFLRNVTDIFEHHEFRLRDRGLELLGVRNRDQPVLVPLQDENRHLERRKTLRRRVIALAIAKGHLQKDVAVAGRAGEFDISLDHGVIDQRGIGERILQPLTGQLRRVEIAHQRAKHRIAQNFEHRRVLVESGARLLPARRVDKD
jgi:hypothetical protein